MEKQVKQNHMKKVCFFIWIMSSAGIMASCTVADPEIYSKKGVLEWVDPRIGTSGHGHTFMGVAVPFGAVQVGPNNFNKGWDWCSGYHASDSICVGFTHLHLNGTGCSDTGDIRMMPTVGTVQVSPGSQEDPDSGYASRYSHENEFVSPSYYRLFLDDYGINAEFTSTERVGFHRYTFPGQIQEKQIIIDLLNGNGDYRATETYIEQQDNCTVRGYRYSTGWSKRQRIYFTAIFSEPVDLDIYRDDALVPGSSVERGVNLKGVVKLSETAGPVMVKVGISPVSMAGSARNIEAELPGWDFDAAVRLSSMKWTHELGKVDIAGASDRDRRIFYTALYHAFLQPALFNDSDGAYRGADGKNYPDPGHETYTVLSLWDTYRAAHPLYTILQPERVPDMVNTMLDIYDGQGMLPVWHLYGCDTQEMIGIQSIPVIADAVMKGFPGIDYNRALKAMSSSMMSNYKGLEWLQTLGWIPADKEKESVAKGLEYAIADGSISLVAEKLDDQETAGYFRMRSGYYKNYWDASTKFFRGKKSDGSFREPFNPFMSLHRNDDYCEGTGWQYAWLVPHDVHGLIKLFGGDEGFVSKLDSLFVVEGDMGDAASGDISGLIGQYAHGNEPGHHTVYLYAYAGMQWKTSAMVRRILAEMYTDSPDGLAGNEDCGQMSSWYVLSAMGFYPVNPSLGIYVFGSPAFEKISIHLPGKKTFNVIADGNSEDSIYIQSAELNGKPYPYTWIKHSDIVKGGTLRFVMGNVPQKHFGAAPEFRPVDR